MTVFISKYSCRHAKSLSRIWLFATLWTVACQAPLSMGFSRQEYWSGLPCPLPEDLPDPGIKPNFLELQHCRWVLFCFVFFNHWATKEAPWVNMLIYKWWKINKKVEYTRKICFLTPSLPYGCSNYVRGAEWGLNHHYLLPLGSL